ncbi:hypothetical protein O6H91_01G126000 [Diphasiastrum complanatum]|uniref:Uncharacterized protein n=1 Tax=Diphasiastrum complanatum TaxID=34168 RepID=A0ACC2EVQ0_DIPCM|nr:hypothetical protein O6H91_01G126000 [Diphasiastrum complanatum]
MAQDKEKHGHLPRWKSIKLQAQTTLLTVFDKILGTSKGGSRKYNKEQATVIVGPVIGKVTNTIARILIETDRNASVTVSVSEQPKNAIGLSRTQSGGLTSPGRKSGPLVDEPSPRSKEKKNGTKHGRKHAKLSKGVVGMRPTVFEFTGLAPGTRYEVQLKGCISPVASSFSTFPEEPSDVTNVAVISCNKIFITQQAIPIHSDLWAHLAKNIESGKVDLVLHLGDQIYGDGDKMIDAEAGSDRDRWSDRFRLAKDMLNNVPKEQWQDHRDEICEKYREVYRETWQHLPTAKCLANCPNLMIYDDHEVRDNWVNLEYQRQLHENVDFLKLDHINKDYHFHVVGGVGLLFLDIRGSRTFHRKKLDEKPYLGSSQWNDITSSLKPNGLFDKVRVLLVCSPAPLVFLEPTITNAAAKRVHQLEDFKGHWSASMHIKEQVEMINCLWTWKNSTTNREVLVLGGDVHCGGHSEILCQNKILFRQLTTSAIANMPLPKSAYYFMRAAGRIGHLNAAYTFRHHDWTRSRNYGMLQIKNHREEVLDTKFEKVHIEKCSVCLKFETALLCLGNLCDIELSLIILDQTFWT